MRRVLPVLLLLAAILPGWPAAARGPAHAPHPAAQADLARRVEQAIADGSVFALSHLRQEAREALEGYRADDPAAGGTEARRIAPRLEGESVAAFRRIVEADAARDHATRSEVTGIQGHGGRRQTMTVWEFTDGTVVRFKPDGDPWRDAPTYSVEVKDMRRLSNAEAKLQAIAFKVDPKGRPVPASPRQVAIPRGLPAASVDDWVDLVMDAGHRTLKP